MDETNSGITVLLLIFRIVITIYCVNKAGSLNRDKMSWGIFAFLIPLIALIWIQFMKPKNDFT